MPSAAAMARSSGVVMKPRTRSALAPTYVVRTVTDALSSLGYCLTLSDRIAWKPAMTITRLTTIARTGRRTKMSVSFMIALPIVRVRRELRVDLDLVVHGDGRPVSKLEGARADDVLPGRDAVDDRHEVAPGGADAHELLPRHLRGLVAGRRAPWSGSTTETLANIPGRSVSSLLGTAARTRIVRVVVSIVGSTAAIVPSRGATSAPSMVTRIGMPILISARRCCGRVKST